MSESPAISFRGVTKRYGTQEALQPTDLDIEEGEFFCLLGPSGLRQDDDAQPRRRVRRAERGRDPDPRRAASTGCRPTAAR